MMFNISYIYILCHGVSPAGDTEGLEQAAVAAWFISWALLSGYIVINVVMAVVVDRRVYYMCVILIIYIIL